MSLSRLREFAMPIILDYLDPTGENRKEAVEIDVNTTSESKAISRVYSKNKAITFFTHNNLYGVMSSHINPELCFDYRFVKQNDNDHDLYHKSVEDTEIQHMHVLKGSTSHSELNEKDFNCLIDEFKKLQLKIQSEEEMELENFLSNEDSKRIKQDYNKYLRLKRRGVTITNNAEKVYEEVEKLCITAAQSFTQAFVTTLLDKYVQALLINQGLSYRYAKGRVELLKSLITNGLGSSYLQTTLDFIIRNITGSILSKLSINNHVIEKILAQIGTVVAFTKNPLSMLELGVNGGAAALGQSAAYLVIHALPKLKYEEEFKENNSDKVIQNEDVENSNLRQRRKHP